MIEHKIQTIVEDLASTHSGNFFDTITTSLAKAIGADFVFIASLDEEHNKATSFSLIAEGKLADNISYSLEHTPCQQVADQQVCSHLDNIQALYPEDQLLIDMAIEGYIGVPINNPQGRAQAILVALYRQAIERESEVKALFLLFSGLIAKELDKKRTIEKLQVANQVIHNSHEAILICSSDNKINYANDAFCKITGYSQAEVIGQNPNILNSNTHDISFFRDIWATLKKHGFWSGEICNKNKAGESFTAKLSINTIADDNNNISHYVSFFSDISEHKQAKEQIFFQANFDPLTNLANRQLFTDRVNQAIYLAHRQQSMFAVFMLDLDLFKDINDSYGRHVGNKLLVKVAHRLSTLIRETDSAARISGDSFTLLVSNLHYDQEAESLADKISIAFDDPFYIDDITLHCTFSIGITLYPNDGDNPDSLLKKAEQAMYDAKSNGRNTFSFYTSSMQEAAVRRIGLKNDLQKAIKAESLDVAFQPIICTATKSVAKFEALVRWNNQGEWVSPVEFIPIAEEFGLIKSLGDVVLKKSCLQLKQLKNQGFHSLSFNVNRSIFEFPRNEKDNDQWLYTIHDYGISPRDICFELTESALAPEKSNNIILLQRLQSAGCQIALDDFGTGYSSLSYLRRFPINSLKIDRSFITDMATNYDDKILVSTIIAMAKSLGINVVAEGAETREQTKMLAQMGCDYIQGYYFSKPLPGDQLADYLHKFNYLIEVH